MWLEYKDCLIHVSLATDITKDNREGLFSLIFYWNFSTDGEQAYTKISFKSEEERDEFYSTVRSRVL